MKILSSAILLLSTALLTVSASNVISLKDDQQFDETIKNNKFTLISFYSPECQDCKELKPTLEDVAYNLKQDNVVVAEIDCTQIGSVCSKYQAQVYPTIRLFRNGRPSNRLELDNKDNYESITQFVQSEIDYGLTELNNLQDLENIKTQEPLLAVAYISPDQQEMINAWESFSEKLRDDFAFALVTDKAVMEAENITSVPSFVLYKHFDHLRDVYQGEFKPDEMEDFIKVNAVPFLAPIEPSRFMDYVDAGRPIVYIFSDTPETQAQMQDLLLPLAQQYRGDFSFAHINATEYTSQADFLSLKNKWPALAVHNFKTGARFPFDQSKSLDNQQVIVDFLDQIKQGTLKPAIKSQAFPIRNPDDPVQIVVGNDFEEVVMDTSKDVLLEIYAPWCGHCRQLAPIYQQLGEFIKKQDNEGLLIAKMDGTVNDIPLSAGFSLTAFPTIKLFKSGTNEIIDYTGERNLRGFVDFLNSHSTKKLNLDVSQLPKEETKLEETKHDEL